MQCQRGLAVFVSGEVLRHGRGNGLVAGHNALGQTAHGLDAQRQRNHVQQQQVTRGVVARQLVGLDGGAQCDDFIGVEVGQRRFAKKLCHCAAHLRHAGGAADHHHALHIIRLEFGVSQRLAHCRHGAGCQMGGDCLKLSVFDIKLHCSPSQQCMDSYVFSSILV